MALELLPIVVGEHVEGDVKWWPGPLGCAVGVIVFMAMKHVLPEGPDELEDAGAGRLNTAAYASDRPLSPSTAAHEGAALLVGAPPPAYTVESCRGAACIQKIEREGLMLDIEELSLLAGTAVRHREKCVGKCSTAPDLTLVSSGERLPPISLGSASKARLPEIRSTIAATLKIDNGPGRSPAGGGLPWIRMSAIWIDAFVDGITVGIALSVGFKEALIIAIGMALEMGFVGVTLSCTLQPIPRPSWVKLFIVCFTPMFMYFGWLLGAFALYEVEQSSDIFVAVIGFAAVALLYLAFVELLPEAHELGPGTGRTNYGDFITVALFAGLLVVLLLENVVPEDTAAEENGPF